MFTQLLALPLPRAVPPLTSPAPALPLEVVTAFMFLAPRPLPLNSIPTPSGGYSGNTPSSSASPYQPISAPVESTSTPIGYQPSSSAPAASIPTGGYGGGYGGGGYSKPAETPTPSAGGYGGYSNGNGKYGGGY